MARPTEDETLEARALGIRARDAARSVERFGGIERLKRMTPSARALVLAPAKYKVGNFASVKKGGLAARGMGQRRGFIARDYPVQDRGVEAEIQSILRERGLVEGMSWDATAGKFV